MNVLARGNCLYKGIEVRRLNRMEKQEVRWKVTAGEGRSEGSKPQGLQ